MGCFKALRFKAKKPLATLPMSLSVVVLDDHPLVARGIAGYIESIRPDFGVLVANSIDELHQLINQHGPPRLVVCDVWLASGNMLDELAKFASQFPGTPWLAISGDDDPSIPGRMQTGGAWGFVHKRAAPDIFAKAFEALLNGQRWFHVPCLAHSLHPTSRDWLITPEELGLTKRQGEILELVLRGLPNKRIALMLHLSESTVKEHVTAILDRLGVRTRIEAITHLRGRRLAGCSTPLANEKAG